MSVCHFVLRPSAIRLSIRLSVFVGLSICLSVRLSVVCRQCVCSLSASVGCATLYNICNFQDHDVPAENILLVTLIAAELGKQPPPRQPTTVLTHRSSDNVGIHTVAYAFPDVKIITTAVDPVVNDHYHIVPGIGTSTSMIVVTT